MKTSQNSIKISRVNPATMITTVIFDLDGLLADTERLHCRAYQTALLEHGVSLSETDYAEHWVRSGKGIVEWVGVHCSDLDPHAVRARKSEHYLTLLRSSLRPMDGALELLNALHGTKKIALASSSYRDAVDGVLSGLNIAHYFEVIVSGLDVARVKPSPDIFLKAASQLGAKPSECLVLEDAEKGVLAAYHAGMRCIAVPNEHTRHHDFSKATRICASLSEITLEFLDSLAKDPA
ncbi:MAG TPA: HAD family phosphatase [Candidatus Binatia bacterium]|nr:HAD family phosphatase [Candidatus Binatia bacterium]